MKNDKIWKPYSIQDAKFEINKTFTTTQFTYQTDVKDFTVSTQIKQKSWLIILNLNSRLNPEWPLSPKYIKLM